MSADCWSWRSQGLPSVSVAVPNYNYARHLPLRLGSIFSQSHPVHEIIVLDDASTDDSATVIPAIAAEWDREIRFIPNLINSGSVFAQWRRAAELATGDFIWLAEADDAAEPDFLTRALALLSSDPTIQLAFTNSRTIDAEGKPQWTSYKPYYGTVVPGGLAQTEVFEAKDFVQQFLSVKNLILNVSCVVWRRDALLRALTICEAELADFRMAGDWRLYLEALALPGAKVAYEAEPLNVHRRHATSVTHALDATGTWRRSRAAMRSFGRFLRRRRGCVRARRHMRRKSHSSWVLHRAKPRRWQKLGKRVRGRRNSGARREEIESKR